MHYVIANLDTGAELRIPRSDAMKPAWRSTINTETTLAIRYTSNQHLDIIGIIEICLRMGESRTRAVVFVVQSQEVLLILRKSPMDLTVKGILFLGRCIVPSHDPARPTAAVSAKSEKRLEEESGQEASQGPTKRDSKRLPKRKRTRWRL